MTTNTTITDTTFSNITATTIANITATSITNITTSTTTTSLISTTSTGAGPAWEKGERNKNSVNVLRHYQVDARAERNF